MPCPGSLEILDGADVREVRGVVLSVASDLFKAGGVGWARLGWLEETPLLHALCLHPGVWLQGVMSYLLLL